MMNMLIINIFMIQMFKKDKLYLNIGDLVCILDKEGTESKKIGLILKVKNNLKLCDVLIQGEQYILKDISYKFIKKIS